MAQDAPSPHHTAGDAPNRHHTAGDAPHHTTGDAPHHKAQNAPNRHTAQTTPPHDAAGDAPDRPHTAQRALLILSLLAVTGVLALGVRALLYPHQTSYVEGYLLEQGVRLAGGGALYRPLGEPAWIVDNFPPLYPLAMALGVKLFGPSFAFGRLLTLVSAAGLLALAVAWHRRTGTPSVVALGLATLWLTSPYVVRRALLVRMDLAAILVVGLAIWTYLQLSERRPALAAPVAAVLFALALGMRQTMIAAPLALLVVLVWHDRRRDTTLLMGILSLIGFVAVWMLQTTTDGGFLRHTVSYNTGRYLLDNYLLRLGLTFLYQLPLLVLGGIGAVVALRRGRFEDRLLAVWGLLALLATWTAGKPGSTYNHFLELLFVAGLLAGHAVRPVAERLLLRTSVAQRGAGADAGSARAIESTAMPAGIKVPNAPTRTATALLLLVVLAIHLPLAATSPAVQTGIDALNQGDADAALEARLADTPAPILSENAGALVRTGHDVLLEPRTLRELAETGEWNDSVLNDAIRNHTYTLLVLETFPAAHLCDLLCRFTDDTRAAIRTHYTHTDTIGRWQLWTPTAA